MARGDIRDNSFDPYREYDTRGTNLPEVSNQMELEDEEAAYAAFLAKQHEQEMQQGAHYWPDVGKFAVPKDKDSFQAHLERVRQDLQFDPSHYPYFDYIVLKYADRPEIFHPDHADFPKYAALRENLAVLRNDIMCTLMDDGSFDRGDEKFVPVLKNIAETLGRGIADDRNFITRMISPHVDVDKLNIPGEGAAHAYAFLREQQREPGMFAELRRNFRRLANLPVNEWNLPPIELTPFSKSGLDAPPPAEMLTMTRQEADERCANQWSERVRKAGEVTHGLAV